MLNCVYHVLGDMQVVDNDESDRLLATGFWFDHPNKAKEARERYEREAINANQPKPIKEAKAKQKEKDHEKSSNV